MHRHTKLAELTESPTAMANVIHDLLTDNPEDLVYFIPIYKRRLDKGEQIRLHEELRTADSANKGQ